MQLLQEISWHFSVASARPKCVTLLQNAVDFAGLVYLCQQKATDLGFTLHKKRRFPLRVSSVNVIKSALPSDLVAFTDQILNRKLHLMCSVIYHLHKNLRHRSLLEP